MVGSPELPEWGKPSRANCAGVPSGLGLSRWILVLLTKIMLNCAVLDETEDRVEPLTCEFRLLFALGVAS